MRSSQAIRCFGSEALKSHWNRTAELVFLIRLWVFAGLSFSLLAAPCLAQDELDPFESNNREFLRETTRPESKEDPKTDPRKSKEAGAGPVSRVIPKPKVKDPEDDSPSRISDVALPLQSADVPRRPTPLLELGDPFLGTGPVSLGFRIPTGGVWQPSLLIYGNFRSGFNGFRQQRSGRSGHDDVAEWSNRLDIFANLQLAGFANERFVFGMRPLDEALSGRRFSGYRFEPTSDEGSENGFNDRVVALFFEGDLGELLPFLDEQDKSGFDFGFSVGRQQLTFQSGIMVNDIVDAVGLTRNNLTLPWASNMRITALYAWNQLHRNNFIRDDSGNFFGLFSSTDFTFTTIDADLAYFMSEEDTGDAFFAGFSATQRFFGTFNTTVRVNLSVPTENQTAANRRGTLLTFEGSWTPTGSEDNFFFNAYLGIDRYNSALRSPDSGGPLERVGILYASIGLGRYPSPLDNRPDRSAGGSVGYQFFFGQTMRQLILELGGRKGLTGGVNRGMMAFGARFQQAFWQRFIVRFDAFISKQELVQETGGGHIELQIQF
jgi:hypothetical protein